MIYILVHVSQTDTLFTFKNIFPSMKILKVLKLANLHYEEMLQKSNIITYNTHYEFIRLLDKYQNDNVIVYNPCVPDMLNLLESKMTKYHIMY